MAHGMMLLILTLVFVFPLEAINITAVGSPTYYPFVKAWADSYSLLNPDFHLNFEPSTSGAVGIAQLVNDTDQNGNKTVNKTIGLVLADGSPPTAQQYQFGLQTIPMLITTFVAQINLGFNADVLLNGSVIADIFMGKITNWADPAIVATNPKVPLPNATILVCYRSDVTPATSLWTGALSKWSPTWNVTYGATNSFPASLRAKPNFFGYPDLLSLNGAIAGTIHSIGYVQYYSVARDTGLHYSHLFNKYSGIETTPATLSDASISLNPLLNSPSIVDPPGDNHSWPIVATVGFVLPTHPADCSLAREVYKFLRWSFTATNPRHATSQLGCIPLTTNLTNVVLKALLNITCNGESIGAYETNTTRHAYEYVIFAISIIVLFLALVLSASHIHNFRNSKILMVYTFVFVFGTLLTLLSPVTWWLDPTHDSICQGRVWTFSLGFSIMLGTMFARTWQLKEIYYLQKGGIERLRKKISTNKTYFQLAFTLCGVIFINLIILVAWSAYDPMSSVFLISDEVQLTGYWTCQSNNITPWLIIETIFFLGLLCFGIYVIYDTWSFQRAVVLTETRWVLFALYNVILNMVAIAPFVGLINLDDRTLAFVVIASTDLSAGSIACAVLLPKVLQNFKWTQTSKHTGGTGTKDINSQQNKSGVKPEESNQVINTKQKRRPSRTPEDELAKRLEEPRPLYGSELEMHPISTSRGPDPSQEVEAESPRDIDSPSLHPLTRIQEHPSDSDSLRWSENPIKENETS